jgi:hypothetical protein
MVRVPRRQRLAANCLITEKDYAEGVQRNELNPAEIPELQISIVEVRYRVTL